MRKSQRRTSEALSPAAWYACEGKELNDVPMTPIAW
jgi:hypothetical protein